MTSYSTSVDTIFLSHIVLEIFDFKVFRVWSWPLTPEGHLKSKKNFIPFERPYMISYLTSMDTISLSLTALEIYSTSKFLGFDLDLWPLKVIWSQKISYHSRGHIWLPIRLLWTPSLYLLPFSRYSTSKFLGFDLDLWPLKVIRGQKILYHSKGHIWLPIWLLWTPSLYLLPFSRYSTSKFSGFDLDHWPLKVIWSRKNSYHSKGHIWLPIWLLWTPSLYLVPFWRYSTSKFLGFDLDLWPLEVIWGQKNWISLERPYMTSYSTSVDTIFLSHIVLEIFDFKVFRVWPWPLTPKGHPRSKYFIPSERPYLTSYLICMDAFSLSLTVFEIFDFKIFRVWPWPWPLKVIWDQQILYYSKGHIWFPIWLLWTLSLYLLPFSRYSNSKILVFDLDFWPLKSHLGSKNFILFERPCMTSYLTFFEHHPSISYRSRDNAGQNFEPRTKWRILTL